MARRIGLLVGIDNYPAETGVSTLRGCRNDIDHWKTILEDHYANSEDLRVLKDEQATYSGVVGAFADCTARLESGDHFCFVYCGHGSREPAADVFAAYFPEGLQETLVCFDSRMPGGLELADKELLYLIADATARGAEVTVILDCCHSGSGTRAGIVPSGMQVRRAPDRTDVRQLETYLVGRVARDLRAQGRTYRLPNPPHILIAACRRTEEARELPTRRGLLSSAAESVIRKAGGRLTYVDLHRQLTVAALGITDVQHPVLETYGGRDAYAGLLGTAAEAGRAAVPVIRETDGSWSVPLGAIHGLAGENAAQLSFQLLRDGQPVAIAGARSVGFDRTVMDPPAGGLAEGEYTALLLSPPRPAALVHLAVGESWQRELAAAFAARPSAYFTLSAAAPYASYTLVETSDGLELLRRADGMRLYSASGSDRSVVVTVVLERVETVMRWEYLVALDVRRAGTSVPVPDLILEVERGDEWREVPAEDGEVTVVLPGTGGKASELSFRVVLRNRDPRRKLFCALFFTTENYTFYFTGFNEPLGPQSSAVAWDTVGNGAPTRFAPSGSPASWHLLKLFVSEREIDVTGLDRKGFPLGQHDRFAGPQVHRGMVPGIDSFIYRAPGDDWRGLVTRIRVLEQPPVIGEQPVSLLGGQVTVRARRDGFSARITLAPLGGGARGLAGDDALADLLVDHDVEFLQFSSGSRGGEPLYSVVELSELRHPEVLAEDPLEIELRQSVGADQGLQALAFDGEHLLPVGEFGAEGAEGMQLLRIHHLPQSRAGDSRSVIGAVKLIVYKYVLRQSGCRLRWVDYSGPKPRRTATDLRARVQVARKILLLIHGIIGDTEGMAGFSQELVARGYFDLVLTFDYENLITPLEDTSRALSRALETEAGIEPDQGLVILAHSMGGLVARHYIECRKGGQLVDGLLMAGTPNAGSEIARLTKYRDYGMLLLGFAINSGWALGAAAAVLTGLKATKTVTRTLEQLLPDSTFLGLLEDAPDPGIPYRILAGDLSGYLKERDSARRLMDKLYLLGGRTFYQDLPNDLAVSIASINSIDRERSPAVDHRQVACHHLNYFTEPASVTALEAFLSEIG